MLKNAANEIELLRNGNEQLRALVRDGCKQFRADDFGGGNVF